MGLAFRAITPQRTVDMVPRVTGTLRTQQMTYLVVLPLWPMRRSQWLLPRMSNFLPTASLSVFPLYILSDGMHKGGTTLPGASMETQAESGSLPYRDLSTPTCQYSGTGWGLSLFLSLAILFSSVKWAVQPSLKLRRRHRARD